MISRLENEVVSLKKELSECQDSRNELQQQITHLGEEKKLFEEKLTKRIGDLDRENHHLKKEVDRLQTNDPQRLEEQPLRVDVKEFRRLSEQFEQRNRQLEREIAGFPAEIEEVRNHYRQSLQQWMETQGLL